MKRINNLYENICSLANLKEADRIARKGKARQKGVLIHDRSPDSNILVLHEALINKRFKTSAYKHFTVSDPKERLISSLPYYPDRIVHHAIMNYLEPIFVAAFTADTYSCIKGRGIHACHEAIKKGLRDVAGTTYYLQLDVTKFYPSIDHDILKAQLGRKFKDHDLLALLSEIIDSAPGVPIGNYLSQYFANFYLSQADHFIKEVLAVKKYYRYADDMLILADDKDYLRELLVKIEVYLWLNLKLKVKPNWKIKPVDDHGINMLGFVYRHEYVLLRKSIKKNWARAVKKNKNRQSLAAYEGWGKHCNSINLQKTLSQHDNNKIIQRAGGRIKEPDRP